MTTATLEPITATPEVVPPEGEDIPAVPAEDPQPAGKPIPRYDGVFALFYQTVLATITGTSRAKGSALKPYEMKAADVALVLAQQACYTLGDA